MSTDIYMVIEQQGRDGIWRNLRDVSPYNDQNYTVFALLAGVRNQKVKIRPLAECRGIPTDACQAAQKLWEEPHYAQSYFYLSELVQVNWTRKLKRPIDTLTLEGKILQAGEIVTLREECNYFYDDFLIPLCKQVGKDKLLGTRLVFAFIT